MKKLLLAFLSTCFLDGACTALKPDPDTLPSVEVLLVPPKRPFPQVQAEITRLKRSREKSDQALLLKVVGAYQKALGKLQKSISDTTVKYIKPLYKTRTSFLQQGDDSRHVENVAIRVMAMPKPGLKVKNTIKDIAKKRSSEFRLQVDQGVKEFDQVLKLIVQAVDTSMRKYFGTRQSFLQVDDATIYGGIRPILNLRVGSSSQGDGLADGSSFPSVVGLVEEFNEEKSASELFILNAILRMTRKLGVQAIMMLKSSIFPPLMPNSFLQASPLTPQIKAAMQYLPPAFSGIMRRRGLEHSTVELDLYPPVDDDVTTTEVLHAVLQAEVELKKSRVRAYVGVRKRLVRDILAKIGATVRAAAVQWGQVVDSSNVLR